MARVWHCGFGLGTLNTAVEVTTNSGTVSVQNTVSRPGSSGWALRVNPTASTGFVRQHIAATDQSTVGIQRFALRVDTLPSANTTICRFQDSANNPVGQLRLTTAGKVQLWTAAGSQIGSDSATLTSGDGSWNIVELKIDATGAGTLEARAAGTVFASGANNIAGAWSRIVIGVIGTACTTDLYFTDWALNDTTGSFQNGYPGDGHIIYQRPAGPGDANAWNNTANTAGGTTNWTLVDETPPNDATDLVQTGTLNAEDMYAVAASGIGASDTVSCVLVGVRMRNNTADVTTTAKLQIKKTSGGTILQGSAMTPNSASYSTNASVEPRNYTLVAHRDPDGNAWAQSTLDSMQIGAKLTAAGTNRFQISAIWAAVDYTPSAGGGQTITLSGIASAEAFGALAVAQSISPAAVPSAEAFGQAAIAVTIALTGIATAEAFGAAALTLGVALSGVPIGEAFGVPALAQDQQIAPTGIASAEALGVLAAGSTVALPGIGSAEVFGATAVTPDGSIAIAGIPSGEAFGALALAQLLALTGIASSEAAGVPALGQAIAPAGIGSGEAFGNAAAGLAMELPGVDTSEAFGGLLAAVEVALAGIGSAETLGTLAVTGDNEVLLVGIAPSETFGTIVVTGGLVILPNRLGGTARVIGQLSGGAALRGALSGRVR